MDKPKLFDIIWTPTSAFTFWFFGTCIASSLTNWIFFPLWVIGVGMLLVVLLCLTEVLDTWWNSYKQEIH